MKGSGGDGFIALCALQRKNTDDCGNGQEGVGIHGVRAGNIHAKAHTIDSTCCIDGSLQVAADIAHRT